LSARNIVLQLSYDGTDFCGWERQMQGGRPSGRAVQTVLEAALAKMHKQPVPVTGSGRTDAGVHARVQVANFYSNIQSIPVERFVPALNSLLPHDLRVNRAWEAEDSFHARFDAKSRSYRYFFVTGRQALPWELRYSIPLYRQPCIERLNAFCSLLHGEMDCSSFASPADESKSRFRDIKNAAWHYSGSFLVFDICANAFLWKMVRTIAGTLLRADEKGLSPADFRKIIERRDRAAAGSALPPQGLFLWHVEYYNSKKQ
jgi:tRNA pseudouridine38-40 synthase